MWVPVLFAAAMASGLTGLLYMLLKKKTERTEQRLRSLTIQPGSPDDPQLVENIRQMVHTTLPKVGQTLLPNDADERSRLATRLLHAGLYHPSAMTLFLGVKFLLIAGPLVASIVIAIIGFLAAVTTGVVVRVVESQRRASTQLLIDSINNALSTQASKLVDQTRN